MKLDREFEKKKIKNEFFILRTSGIDILFSSKPQFTTSYI